MLTAQLVQIRSCKTTDLRSASGLSPVKCGFPWLQSSYRIHLVAYPATCETDLNDSSGCQSDTANDGSCSTFTTNSMHAHGSCKSLPSCDGRHCNDPELICLSSHSVLSQSLAANRLNCLCLSESRSTACCKGKGNIIFAYNLHRCASNAAKQRWK